MTFDSRSTLIERELRAAVEKRCNEVVAQLSTGSGVTSFEDYRRLTGYVGAFTEVVQMIDEVRAKISKQEGSR
jgi:hypothetical protein